MTMLALVAAVLFLHHPSYCTADDGSGDHLLFALVDHVLHQTIYSLPRNNFKESMMPVFETINSSFVACLVTSKQQWRQLQEKSQFPKICGSIGYTEAEPVSLIWTIDTYFGVFMNVTYLMLPFFG